MRFVEIGATRITGTDPLILDAGKASFVIDHGALSLPSRSANAFSTRNENDEYNERQKNPPPGNDVRSGGEPDS